MTDILGVDTGTKRPDRLAILLPLLESDPGNLALLADAAEAALDLREAGIAGDLLDRYAAISPLPSREANLAGLAALQMRQFDRAAEIFATLFAGGAKDNALRFNLAWAQANLKNFEQALEVLDDDSARELPQAAMLRVQLLHQLADFDGAGDAARDYILRHPDHRGLMAAVSVLALDIDDEALAEACAARAGEHPDALTTMGTLALGHERATEAVDLFDQALAANPDLPRAWVGLGLAKMLTGETASAAADIDRGANLFGDHLGSWIAAGWAHFVAGDTATSRARFDAAMALDPNFAETHGSLAVLDLLGGDIAEATRRSDIALRLDRKCYSAALAKSLIAASGGDHATAQRIFDHAARTPIGDSGRTIGQALAKMGLGIT
ncbi:tetratricopeptide repeat protein [Sphingomonas sp. ERG5]|uniref:tetratricopeptide repeat protein n=1 Tax=Sphingomonas sp. ERG5 TaxID=1381597 RepID=UPI00054C6204|nr:tetratricopeptide repeat protein [Sphingomonas sp. ERG5]